MYYIILDENKRIYGMYNDDGEYVEESNTIFVNDELFDYLYDQFGPKAFIGEVSDNILTIKDKDLFKIGEVVIPEERPETEILKEEVSRLNEQIMMQDELINVTMMATDEVFMMLEPLLNPEPVSARFSFRMRREVKNPMVDLYVAMVMRGLKTIDEVPARYREQVKEILSVLEK